jgi:hypothetical protein
MIHNYSNQPIYDLLRLINDIEKKTLIVRTGECDLCGRQAKEGLHSENCELDRMRKIIKSLQCGDD